MRRLNPDTEQAVREMRERDSVERKKLDNVFFTIVWLAGGVSAGGAIEIKPEWAESLMAAALVWDEMTTKKDQLVAIERAKRLIAERPTFPAA